MEEPALIRIREFPDGSAIMKSSDGYLVPFYEPPIMQDPPQEYVEPMARAFLRELKDICDR